jgi:2'-5' RNA ligase
VSWVDLIDIHLTLAFLGELDDAQLADAIQAATAAALQVRPFSYTLSHLGVFGPPRQPRVIWMGIEEPSGSLRRLQRILSQQLALCGFQLDNKPFSPHLTLARIKSPLSRTEQERVQKILADKQLYAPAEAEYYPVMHIQVMKSELSRTGAHYLPLYSCELNNA